LPPFFKITFPLLFLFLLFSGCQEETAVPVPKQRVFPGYHSLLDEIVRSREGIFRGLELNSSSSQIIEKEGAEPMESANGQMYYEFSSDSISYSITYVLENDSLEEINVQINTADLDLSNYLFCDLKDYYAHKLPNPYEDKGYVVYNCFEGQRKPYVVSLTDNSSPSKGNISMAIYKDK
jgi:hypothetical protein